MAVKAAVWYRVSKDEQQSANQIPDVERFIEHRGYEVAETYTISDSAFKNGTGGAEYQAALKALKQGAREGRYTVVIVWALDRICRTGMADLLNLINDLEREHCAVISVKEGWLETTDPKIRDVVVGLVGWVAQQESARRSERIKAGLARRAAEGKPIGRQAGATDKRERKTAGYKGNTNAKAKETISDQHC